MLHLVNHIRVNRAFGLHVSDPIPLVVLRQRHSGDLLIEHPLDERTPLVQREGHPLFERFRVKNVRQLLRIELCEHPGTKLFVLVIHRIWVQLPIQFLVPVDH